MSPAVRLALVVVVLGLAVALGYLWRSRNGRFSAVDPGVLAAAGVDPAHDETATAHLTSDDLGAPLGSRATFLQLSSEVCTPCRRTHAVLAAIAAERNDVSHVDLDVAAHLDLVRRFDVMRTPTILLLDGSGAVVGRMSGATDRRQALDALDAGCPVIA
jgi:thiol-disulfide isomerase/thioredoxin